MENIILLKTFITRIEAEMVANLLQSEGIEVRIQTDDCGGVSPGLTMSNGVKLFIEKNNLEKAKDLLNTNL